MNLTNFANTWVEKLSFEQLIAWADQLKVEHHEDRWLDDDWYDHEELLRLEVAEAMAKIGEKK